MGVPPDDSKLSQIPSLKKGRQFPVPWPITSIPPFGPRPLLVDADMPSKSEV
jgi:hypothetical protein